MRCRNRHIGTKGPFCPYAVVYDFKTNRPARGESADAFAARMREAYLGQMAAYRAAVASLAGLPLERVGAELLLVETGAAVLV